MAGLVHVAGPYRDYLQHCTRCGAVLSDYRNSAWPGDQEPPKGWQEGAEVSVSGRMSMIGRLDGAVDCKAALS